jgi:hypothetical protein
MFGTDKKAIEANWSPAQIDDSFADSPRVTLDIPSKLMFFMTENARFKVVHGGRGSGKSWGIARALIYKAHTEGGENGRPLYDAQHNRIKHLILCAREYQNSTADSAYRVIVNQIARMGLSDWFTIEKTRIISKITGAEFIFKGLWQNDNGIRSTEGITICWVEEAQVVSEYSWSILIPTIRGMVGAEIWVSYNPYLATDPTSVLFQGTDPKKPVDPRAIVVEMNHNDNPWFPPDMELDRKILRLRHSRRLPIWIVSTLASIGASQMIRHSAPAHGSGMKYFISIMKPMGCMSSLTTSMPSCRGAELKRTALYSLGCQVSGIGLSRRTIAGPRRSLICAAVTGRSTG